jgi:hypothetical protein
MDDLGKMAQSFLEAKLLEKDQELQGLIHRSKVSLILSLCFFSLFMGLAIFSAAFYLEVNGVQLHDYVNYYASFFVFVSVLFAFMSVAYFKRMRRYQKERADLAAHSF